MNPQRELADALLRKAKDDLAMARRLAGDPAIPAWGIGFHLQQAVEKAIKAVLSLHGIEYPRTHSIAVLVDMVSEHDIAVPPQRESLVLLTPFGVLFRYDEMGPSDAELANLPSHSTLVTQVAEVVEWAEKVIGRDRAD